MLELWLDTQTKKLFESFTSTGKVTLPGFVQGDSLPVTLHLMRSQSNPTIPFVDDPKSGAAITIAIAGSASGGASTPGAPTGTTGGPTPIAEQVLSEDDPQTYSGVLDLNTTEAGTFLGALSDRRSRFEIQIIDAGNISSFQFNCVVSAEVIETGGTAPVPEPDYYTKAEIDALLTAFFRKVNPDDGTSALQWQGDGTLTLNIKGGEAEHWT